MLLLVLPLLLSFTTTTKFASCVPKSPKSWPYMKTYDIWGSDNNTIDTIKSQSTFMDTSNSYSNLLNGGSKKEGKLVRGRKSKG